MAQKITEINEAPFLACEKEIIRLPIFWFDRIQNLLKLPVNRKSAGRLSFQTLFQR
jgi:hypothetical protein